jgi:hypothetical protein
LQILSCFFKTKPSTILSCKAILNVQDVTIRSFLIASFLVASMLAASITQGLVHKGKNRQLIRLMDIPCFIYNLSRRRNKRMKHFRDLNMEKSSVQPQVVVRVPKKFIDSDSFHVRTARAAFFNPGEIRAIEIDLGTIEVLESDKPLMLGCNKSFWKLGHSGRISLVGVTYRVQDHSVRTDEVTVLKRKGPIKVRDGDGKVKLVYATPIPELSVPYKIDSIKVLCEAVWDKENSKLPPPPCYLAATLRASSLFFYFLNDEGEWEPFRDFEAVEAVEAE